MPAVPSSNRLARETSPYLLQHADNPVHWHPWDEEAFAQARAEDKPILLSVGYSACHWCHVMAHESFEDEATANLMNRLFVNIKLDREERPDIDKIYQTSQSLITQRTGGWPLTMFLDPQDRCPFFGGTYFPKEPRHNLRRSGKFSSACTPTTPNTAKPSANRTGRSKTRCIRSTPPPTPRRRRRRRWPTPRTRR